MTPRHHIPTADQAAPVLTRLAALTTASICIRKDKPPELDHGTAGYIRARIAHHLDIARTHPSMPDGYPTHTPGANPSNGGPTGPDADVSLTSVEAAVEALKRYKDQHDDLTTNAYWHIAEAVFHFAAGEQALRKLDNLGTLDDGLGLADDRWCENHLRTTGKTVGRGPKGTKACRWCADFRADVGSYPPAALVAKYDQDGRIYNRDILTHFPDYGKVGA